MESVTLLQAFIMQNDQWIIEGCYGDLIEAALPYCDELRFLNPGTEACLSHCRQRPWEPDKYASASEQHATLDTLLAWVREYETRSDEYGLERHRQIFDSFTGRKQEYCATEAYNEPLAQ